MVASVAAAAWNRRLGRAILLAMLVCWIAAARAATTSLYFTGPPGEYIGQGVTKTWTSADGAFTAKSNTSNGIELKFDGGQEYWTLNFSAPGDVMLSLGDYTEAQRWPFQAPTKPGMDVSGSGRGCNTLTGKFSVLELVLDSNGNVQAFAADFEQHCEGQAKPLIGRVLFNAEGSYAPIPPYNVGTGTSGSTAFGFAATQESATDGSYTLRVAMTVSRNHQGRQGQLFVAAVVGTDVYAYDGRTWTQFDGTTLAAYKTGPLGSVSIDIRGIDPASLAGVKVLAGYGTSYLEMMVNRRYDVVHTF